MTALRQAYATILPLVEQPARYTGGERGTVLKDPGQVQLRFALAFPKSTKLPSLIWVANSLRSTLMADRDPG